MLQQVQNQQKQTKVSSQDISGKGEMSKRAMKKAEKEAKQQNSMNATIPPSSEQFTSATSATFLNMPCVVEYLCEPSTATLETARIIRTVVHTHVPLLSGDSALVMYGSCVFKRVDTKGMRTCTYSNEDQTNHANYVSSSVTTVTTTGAVAESDTQSVKSMMTTCTENVIKGNVFNKEENTRTAMERFAKCLVPFTMKFADPSQTSYSKHQQVINSIKYVMCNPDEKKSAGCSSRSAMNEHSKRNTSKAVKQVKSGRVSTDLVSEVAQTITKIRTRSSVQTTTNTSTY